MGNDAGVKLNCANPRSQMLTFDGLTDDSFCFAYTVASASYDFENPSEAQCMDFYVQGGDGAGVVKTHDICPRGNRDSVKDMQQGVINKLADAGFQNWTGEMYALSEALTPMALYADMLRRSESFRLKDIRELNNRITEAKKVLCWHDGHERNRDGLSQILIDSLEVCLSPAEVAENEAQRKKELEDNMKEGFTWGTIPDTSDWGPSFWKSVFSLLGRAEKTILEGTVQLNSMMINSVEKTLLLLDLPNTLKSMERGNFEEIRKTLLSRQEGGLPGDAFLRQLSPCDIEMLTFIKSAVPTLSLTMKTGNTTVRSFLADRTFLDEAKKVLSGYEDDITEAQIILESAIELYKDADGYGEFDASLNEVKKLLRDFPRIGNFEDLNRALALLNGIEKTSPDIKKQASAALNLIESYEQNLADEAENDMSLAVNAKIFMIDEFARRSGRTEFGKVLLATLWMNQGLDATADADRTRRFVRAQELIRRVSLCKLSAPELRWLDEVNRLLGLLGAPVRRSREITPKSCYDDLPMMAYDASTKQCFVCEEGEHVEPVYNRKNEMISSSCKKDEVKSEDKPKPPKPLKPPKPKPESDTETPPKPEKPLTAPMPAKKYDCTFDELANIKSKAMDPAEKSQILKERKNQCR